MAIDARLVDPLRWSARDDGTIDLHDPSRGETARLAAWTRGVLEGLEAGADLDALEVRAAAAAADAATKAPSRTSVRRLLLTLEKTGLVRITVPLPARIGDWEVLSQLGRGGVGIVLACSRDGHRAVAKMPWDFLHPIRATSALVRWEALALQELRGDGVVRAHALVEHEGTPVLLREMLDGQTLASLHDARPAASLVEALATTRAVGDIMRRVHERGWLLVDAKPGNFFALRDGGVALLDAGNCLPLDGRSPEGVRPRGSIGFTAPEVAAGGAPSVASDVWSLGRMYAFVASGRLSRRHATLDDVLADAPTPAHAALRALCAPRPEARPPSIDEALALLA